MNTIQFSLQRTTNLFLTYFTGGWRKDLRNFLVMFFLAIIFAKTSGDAGTYLSFFIFIILYSVDVARTFSYLGNKTKRFDYLMIPANAIEKIVTNLFIAHIYKFLLYTTAFILGSILGDYLLPLLLPQFYPSSIIIVTAGNNLASLFSPISIFVIFLFQSILFFGSIYFQKSALIKTVLVLFAFSAVFTIGYTILFQSFSGTVDIYGNSLEYYFNEMSRGGNASKAGNVAGYVVIICSTLYFWTLSYLRLRETEV